MTTNNISEILLNEYYEQHFKIHLNTIDNVHNYIERLIIEDIPNLFTLYIESVKETNTYKIFLNNFIKDYIHEIQTNK